MPLYVINARIDLQKLIKHILISLGTGILASFFTGNAVLILFQNEKSLFNPPYYIFTIINTLLYISIGIAAYLVESKNNRPHSNIDFKFIFNLYYFQLFLHFTWIIICFEFNSPVFALVNMIVLILFIFLVTVGFAKNNIDTLIFMIPYLLWHAYLLIFNILQLTQ